MNKKKVIILSVVGCILGIILCTVVTAIISSLTKNDGNIYLYNIALAEKLGNVPMTYVIQFIVSGLYGGIIFGATNVYDIERWSILRCTVIHLVITLIMYFITGFVLMWYDPSDLFDIIGMIIIFVVVYTFIWLINYLSYRSQVKKMNADLRRMIGKEEKDEAGE